MPLAVAASSPPLCRGTTQPMLSPTSTLPVSPEAGW